MVDSNDDLRKLAFQGRVMAWGVDRTDGTARYITEVARGLACDCVCAACKHPLQAVNSEKRSFGPGDKRPFFRHHRGQEKSNCLVLASRHALNRALLEQGLFQLPGGVTRRQVVGASGMAYEGQACWAPEAVRVRAVHERDDVLAVLVLDDGRQIEVLARGTFAIQKNAGVASVIVDLGVQDAAGMSSDEIRRRLFLVPDGLKWECHWNEAELAEKALAAAIENANAEVAYCDDPSIPFIWRRESALHLAAKNIIAKELRIRLPEKRVVVKGEQAGVSAERSWHEPPRDVQLDSVVLEPRLGRVIPDVVVRIGKNEMLVEITVTNPLSSVKTEIFESVGLPVLEIDLRRVSGVVTYETLTQLVIQELHCKAWVFHPRIAAIRSQLDQEVQQEIRAKVEARRRARSEQLKLQDSSDRPTRASDGPSGARGTEQLDQQNGSDRAGGGQLGVNWPRAHSLWLTGAALEAWKRRNPEAAEEWERSQAMRKR
ncbi:MAG: hypothetical protein MUF80_00100 [Burkholderiales bacterium]|nr:hypothetical protein [Burkholderiales bacterium]